MLDVDELDEQLLEALTHLYDPDYAPPAGMYELTLCDPEERPGVSLPDNNELRLSPHTLRQTSKGQKRTVKPFCRKAGPHHE